MAFCAKKTGKEDEEILRKSEVASNNKDCQDMAGVPAVTKAPSKINRKRVTALTLIIVFAESFVFWDHYRVNRDSNTLKSLLMKTRNEALLNQKTFATKFSGNDVTILKGISGNVIQPLHVPTLSAVRYNTKLGQDMIIFTGRGTEPYNVKIHGGDMTFRPWIGFEKHLAVNCTGLVSEGLYPKYGSQW